MNSFEKELNDRNAEWEREKKIHLEKFNNIDDFLNLDWVKVILSEYFELYWAEFSNNKFKFFNSIKEDLLFYESIFDMSRQERKVIRKKIIDIETKYSKLIYFWEYNPVEARIERKELQKNLSKKTNWVITWILNKFNIIMK